LILQRWRPPQPASKRWRLLLLAPLLACPLCLLVYVIFAPAHFDILVLGIDSRGAEGWVARADTVMLVGVQPKRLSVAALSIPRDLSVSVPNYGLQRINTVNTLGEMEQAGNGPLLLSAALEQSMGVRPEGYVRLDFDAFVALVDAVGGVTIDVERELVDYNYPTEDYGVITVRFEPGSQHMDGARALIYARTRYSDDDYRRVERQQQVVGAVLARLANPLTWPGALAAVGQHVDTNMNIFQWLMLSPPLLLGGPGAERFVIDRDYITATAEGVAIPNYDLIGPWLTMNFD
jgi:LCP family protein required for cell wall assembly